MESITDFIKFLKSRRSFHSRKQGHLSRSHPEAALKHQQTADCHDKIIRWFESYQAGEMASEAALPHHDVSSQEELFSLNPLKMDDFPDDLKKELSISLSDEQDAQILQLLEIANRPLDLNELLVGCLRKYGVAHKRSLLTARLYRLAKKKAVHAVGKGTYALGPAPEGYDDSKENEEGEN